MVRRMSSVHSGDKVTSKVECRTAQHMVHDRKSCLGTGISNSTSSESNSITSQLESVVPATNGYIHSNTLGQSSQPQPFVSQAPSWRCSPALAANHHRTHVHVHARTRQNRDRDRSPNRDEVQASALHGPGIHIRCREISRIVRTLRDAFTR